MSVTMQWAVKDSLGEYIHSIEDGNISLTAPSIQGDIGYTFVADGVDDFDWDSKTGSLSFLGGVQFTAYNGMMHIDVSNPTVELDHGSGQIILERGGLLGPPEKVILATVTWDESIKYYRTYLTESGRSILGEQYQAGQELSLLKISLAD